METYGYIMYHLGGKTESDCREERRKLLRSKRIAAILIVSMLAMPGTIGYAAENTVPLDTKGHWAAGVLDKWAGNGWLKGTAEGKMLPNQTITRAEVAALVNASFGFVEKSDATFKDVSAEAWYANAVSIAAKASYLQGSTDGHFRPDAAITRQEMAVIIARLLRLDAVEPPAQYKDAASAPGWSKGAIGAVMKAGLMVGQTTESFGLLKLATRAETVVILDRALGRRTVQPVETPADKPDASEPEKPSAETPQTPAPPAAGGGGTGGSVPGGGGTGGGVPGGGGTPGGGSPTSGQADAYFAEAKTALGGTAIQLKSAPPYGTSLWFAPAGTTKFAESTQQMVLRGNGVATRIAAPEAAGAYRLYVVTGSSTSAASLAALTVANTPNIAGTLKNKVGGVIGTGELVLEDMKGGQFTATITSGAFKLYLPAGYYRAVKLVQGTAETVLFSRFEVAGGKLVGGDSLDLTAYETAEYNVNGELRFDGAAGPTDKDGLAEIVTEGSNRRYTVPVKDGRFGLYLREGIYRVDGFRSADGTWYKAPNRAISVYEVEGMKLTPKVSLKESNVTGRLVGDDGNPGANGVVDIVSRGIGGENYASAVRSDGSFRLYLPDGPYEFRSYDNGLYSQPIGGTFFVRDGKIAEGAATVQLPSMNFAATAKQGGRTVAEGVLVVGSSDGVVFTLPFKDGKLEAALEPGRYTIQGYSGDFGTYALHVPFEIAAGPKSIAFTVPSANVKGSFTGTGEGQNGILSIINVSARETFSTKVLEGKFEAFLPDGEYALYYSDGTSGGYELNQRITIKNGQAAKPQMSFLIPAPNVKGTLKGDSFNPLVKGLLIKSKSAPDSVYFAPVLDGRINLYLPDGDYEVTGYSYNYQETIPLTSSFSVKSGAAIDVWIPSGKFLGLLMEQGGDLISSADMIVKRVGTEDAEYSAPIINGTFKMTLPDGEYRLVGYEEWGTEDFTTLAGGFTVKGGLAEGGIFQATVKASNVEGILHSDEEWYSRLKLYVRNEATQEQHAIEVRNNKFSAYLPNGSYTIQGYYDTANDRFVELGRPLFIPAVSPADKQIVLSKHAVQRGTVKTSADAAARAGTLRVKAAGENGSIYVIPVRVDGTFVFSLPAGEYIAETYTDTTANAAYTLQVPFTIPQDGTPQPLALVIAATISGKAQGAAGEVLPDGILSLKGPAEGSVQIPVQQGAFAKPLADGIYKAESYAVGATSLKVDFTFEVKKGKADRELTIVPVANTIGSAFAADGSTWDAGELVLIQSSPKQQIIELSVSHGRFAGQLEDGTYTIAKLQNGDVYVPILRTLVVSGGRVNDPTVLQLPVPTVPIPVRAQWTDGSAVNDFALEVKARGTSQKLLLPIKDGLSEALLIDGSYEITGYLNESNGKAVPLTIIPFEVKDGKLVPDPAAVQDGRAKADPFTVLLPKN